MSCRAPWIVAAIGVLAAGATGCGLKGSLEMPEKSTNVVIRGPQQPPGDSGTPVSGEPAAPEDPTKPAAPPAMQPPADDRMPPPPLPGGNPGSAHGG